MDTHLAAVSEALCQYESGIDHVVRTRQNLVITVVSEEVLHSEGRQSGELAHEAHLIAYHIHRQGWFLDLWESFHQNVSSFFYSYVYRNTSNGVAHLD